MLSVVLALLAALSNAVSSVLQRKANAAETGSGVGGLLHTLRQPVWLGGFSAVLVSFGLQAGALAHGAVALVQPLLLVELPLTLLLASRVFARPLTRREWPALGAMTGGVAALVTCLSPQGGNPARPDGWAWAATGLACGLLVAGLTVWAAWRGPGSGRAAALGLAAGITFGITAVFMSAALAAGLGQVLGRWQTYAMAVAGVTAMALLQEALRAGSLLAVQPGVTLSDPTVAILLGVLLFHEQVRTGAWLIGEAAAAAAVVLGTRRLSRSPLLAVSTPPSPGPAGAAQPAPGTPQPTGASGAAGRAG